MRHPRVFARLVALAVTISGALPLFASAAQARTPAEVCTAFPYRQTYASDAGLFRAPAWHYDETVTIVYEASSCGASVTGSGNYVLTVAGTATVHEGTDRTGKQIDKRPFTSVLRSSAARQTLGWPIAWWSCFEGGFSYVWTIEDVYTFSVTAQDGRWQMGQTDPASGESTGISIKACRRRSAN